MTRAGAPAKDLGAACSGLAPRWLRVSVTCVSVCMPLLSGAHHSLTAMFDMRRTITLTGELVSVDWRHPHIEILISVDDGGGARQLWRLEGASPGYFRGYEIPRARFEDRIGQIVVVEAHPPRTGSGQAALLNVEFSDGESVEVVPCC